ncbi:hypothetical protein SD71_03295 [Cohnella kolymensis]|uniref:SLH domain-containing protein n=1 Tax=Cohnella kolymensis TaxID=1590652 RepID=A0ABR5A9A8_9BACL|nr:amidase family protein [Cohnella kolymensis]KIL37636.1 hypothetical protein SD71_03295 [Cohnella kolymensis]
MIKWRKGLLSVLSALLLLATFVPAYASPANDAGRQQTPGKKQITSAEFLRMLTDTYSKAGAAAPNLAKNGDQALKREDAALYLYTALKLPKATIKFKDVPSNSKYAAAIGALVKAGMMSGISKDKFGYGNTINTEQAAVLMIRLYDRIKPFKLIEATISDMQKALQSGKITSRELVQIYLDRIEKYDDHGPSLKAIITVNPKALETADSLDKERAEKGPRGPLHGIPIIVKDNYDTFDLPTTAGSASLAGSIPPDDAFQVKKLREAGAIVLAKSNMAEFAFSPYETVSSIEGTTRNPYALDRVPAGSSGGTAASVAANLGAAGLGTDTGNSIRGPSSHNSLVGIRSTIGLTSRDGIVPLNLGRDIGGPIARTVTDATIILDAIAGYDPKDPVTAASIGNMPESYMSFLKKDGLKGARIGVLREFFETPTTDPEIKKLMEQAIEDLRKQGAIIVDPFVIPNHTEIRSKASGGNPFEYELNEYLKSLGTGAKMKTLDDIIASGKFDPSIKDRMLAAQKVDVAPMDDPAYLKGEFYRDRYREAVLKAMADYDIDVIVYPSWSNPPRLIGDLESPHGNNSGLMSPPLGFPALTVPMGFSYDKYPAGLQMLGRPFDEGILIQYAYAYEQATLHRVPPTSTP